MRPAARPWPPALAFCCIVVFALNLRTAIPTIPPLLDAIAADFPVDEGALGVIGAAPSVCFAVFGFAAPFLARGIGLERSVIVVLLLTGVGHVLRGLAVDAATLLAATALTLGAVGIGNVLLPAIIKRYFPSRISVLTAVVGFVFSIATGAAAAMSAGMADAFGWRVSLATWAALCAAAVLPWLLLARGVSADDPAGLEEVEPEPGVLGRVWHSPLAWALATVFGYGAFAIYTLFIWLPSMLRDLAGVPLGASGGLIALFALMGVPMNIVIVLVAGRRRWQIPLTATGIACFAAGYLGLLLAPETGTAVWVALLGLGPFMMQMVLVLLGVRTRTARGTVALSAFVQGVGFALGAAGPPLVGSVHAAVGGWTIPLVILLVGLVAPLAALLVLRRHRMLEDEWHRRPSGRR
ncbi:CynX/NimT family MFS transporter [Microbacterium invictum]|uniref:CP family cyanate transporter-like MFS transporter n=1 Tax=Microbacterium invictum TaxID=515415 RepID=A0AA40SQ95_9MICO|nr:MULTISPECIES: MFS transporter [Microbacterium]MBB4140265.1 CP family cyanate transporter-like MFS transporter [Microbacterium invictum]